MTLEEWKEALKQTGLDVHGHEELILKLDDIIADQETLAATNKKFREDHDALIQAKDKEISELKDKCFRLFERQTNWDDKAVEETKESQDVEEAKPFSFDDMYEITE